MRFTHKIAAALFQDDIGPWVNWHRYRKEKWPGRVRIIQDRSELRELLIPWWRDRDDATIGRDYHEKRAALPTLGAVFARPDAVSNADREKVYALARAFDQARRQAVLALPAYRVTTDRILLLDGLHRCGAILMSGCSFRVALFVIEGPKGDGGCIWDAQVAR